MKKIGGKRLFTLLAMGTPDGGARTARKDYLVSKKSLPLSGQNAFRILDVNGYLKYRCTGKMVTELSAAVRLWV